MWKDILIQVAFFLVSGFMYLWMHQIPQNTYAKLLQYKNRNSTQAKRHFVRGAQLLGQAQGAKDRAEAGQLAGLAAEEADKAIALVPSDAAAHILKAVALDLQGFRASALDSLDAALSPMAIKSLSEEERSDALLKRAELKIKLSQTQPERLDSAIDDVVESVKLRADNARAYCVLGGCYEKKGLIEEAKTAYEEASRVDPKSIAARDGMERLGF